MATETSNRMLDSFPASFIVGSCILGLVILFLTPLKFMLYFPNWLMNPLSTSQGAEVLSRFGAIILLSFPFGVPLIFLDVFFIRTNGINEGVHEFFCLLGKGKLRLIIPSFRCRIDGFKQISKVPFMASPVFFSWLRKKRHLQDFYYLVVANQIVNDLLVGCEIAVMFNIVWMVFLVLPEYLLRFKYDFLSPLVMLVASIILLFTVWFYNRYYWRDQSSHSNEMFVNGFTAYLEKKQIKKKQKKDLI